MIHYFSGNDRLSYECYSSISKSLGAEKFRPEWDSNHDLRDAGSVLYQLSFRPYWELAIMWVHDKPVDYKRIYNYTVKTHPQWPPWEQQKVAVVEKWPLGGGRVVI